MASSMVNPDEDTLQYAAAQAVANTILGPCAIGWSLQLILGGMATSLAGSLLLSKEARVGRLSKPLLAIAMCMNLASIAVNTTEIWQYMLNQDRSSATLNSYTLADSIAPLFAGLTVSTCQTFMGLRCYRLSGRSYWLAGVIVLGTATSLGGCLWLTIANLLYQKGAVGPDDLLAPTELWLWAAVAIDLILTIVLSWSLRKMKAGFNQSTDEFISALIRLSFESCAAPLFSSLLTAVFYAATFRLPTLWNMFNATAPAIPGVYLISLCYCLRGSAANHKKMQESSYLPTSAIKTNGGQASQIKSGMRDTVTIEKQPMWKHSSRSSPLSMPSRRGAGAPAAATAAQPPAQHVIFPLEQYVEKDGGNPRSPTKPNFLRSNSYGRSRSATMTKTVSETPDEPMLPPRAYFDDDSDESYGSDAEAERELCLGRTKSQTQGGGASTSSRPAAHSDSQAATQSRLSVMVHVEKITTVDG